MRSNGRVRGSRRANGVLGVALRPGSAAKAAEPPHPALRATFSHKGRRVSLSLPHDVAITTTIWYYAATRVAGAWRAPCLPPVKAP